ncbi:MAG: ABC transporter ATP-binding protein, partial [Clostridia bacterium]|nr:ABC transporter ATP-binding protein [Clostridia bacterium]
MIKLVDLKKSYKVADTFIPVLKGINLTFRESEMVAILGQSGCGKTTMLNVVGGLDHVFDGDIIVDGKSTQTFTDADWDAYRNTKVGFVFQNYNLIHHLSVLENVEIALAMSGATKMERRKKATAVLNRVGLGDHLNKRPNQLSGGQMQRVSIARALINDPQIILADEPTGALDSETSVAVMDILKEISKERLVVLVTHNGELADKYATRIVKMLDGEIIDDSNPYEPTDEPTTKTSDQLTQQKKETKTQQKTKRPRSKMSFWTALTLSFKNLLTKRGRTVMTAIAGSIGIISIALVMGLSAGFSAYIDKMQEDTLSSYPLTITQEGINQEALLNIKPLKEMEEYPTAHKVFYFKIKETMEKLTKANDITNEYLDTVIKPIEQNREICFGVSYGYDKPINVFSHATTFGMHMQIPNATFTQLVNNDEYILSQYDILTGRLPSAYNEVVLMVDQYNQIYDVYATLLGLNTTDATSVTFDEILQVKMRVVTDHVLYKETDGIYTSRLIQSMIMDSVFTDAVKQENFGFDLKIVGIIRANE